MNKEDLWQQAVIWGEQNRADTNTLIWYFEKILGGDYQAYRKWEMAYLEAAESTP